MRHPKIDALDLRSKEGRLRSGLLAMQELARKFREAWEESELWMDWDSVEWNFKKWSDS